MTREHSNVARMRDGYGAFAHADLEAFAGFLADDVLWHFPGASPMSGDYRGHEEVFGFFMKIFEETGGTFTVEVRDVMANDDHGIAIVLVTGERGGRSIESEQVHVAHLTADGRVSEFWNMPADVGALDRFWG